MNISFKRIVLTAGWMAAVGYATPVLAADCINGINTANCTVPTGVASVVIEVWGGGGGAGGGDIGINGGGGAGGGSYCRGSFALAAGTALTVSVGAGGTGGWNDATAGGTSTVSWAGGSISAVGGSPGVVNVQGLGGAACTGAGLTGFAGGNGAEGAATTSDVGGGGGGSAGPASNGNTGFLASGGSAVVDGGKGGDEDNAGQAPGGGGGGSRSGFGLDGGAGQVKMAFTMAPPVGAQNVPTLSEWALMLLGSLVLLLGMRRLQRGRD
jgi:MSHA biogenesis protein MshQ